MFIEFESNLKAPGGIVEIDETYAGRSIRRLGREICEEKEKGVKGAVAPGGILRLPSRFSAVGIREVDKPDCPHFSTVILVILYRNIHFTR